MEGGSLGPHPYGIAAALRPTVCPRRAGPVLQVWDPSFGSADSITTSSYNQ